MRSQIRELIRSGVPMCMLLLLFGLWLVCILAVPTAAVMVILWLSGCIS